MTKREIFSAYVIIMVKIMPLILQWAAAGGSSINGSMWSLKEEVHSVESAKNN